MTAIHSLFQGRVIVLALAIQSLSPASVLAKPQPNQPPIVTFHCVNGVAWGDPRALPLAGVGRDAVFYNAECDSVIVEFPQLVPTAAGGQAVSKFTLKKPGGLRLWFNNPGVYPYKVGFFTCHAAEKLATGTIWVKSLDGVPSLTPYGLAALILLLGGTALWVLRSRRAQLAR